VLAHPAYILGKRLRIYANLPAGILALQYGEEVKSILKSLTVYGFREVVSMSDLLPALNNRFHWVERRQRELLLR